MIAYYKIFYVPKTRSDSEATVIEIKNPNAREFVIDELLKWSGYRLWMLAGTSVGDGPKSSPIDIQTDEDVYIPGEPRDVRAEPFNSSSILVRWKAPEDENQNGIIRAYQIYIQPKKTDGVHQYYSQPLRFNTGNPQVTAFNVTGLQPDTKYKVQVAAMTRKGDGTRSEPVNVKTPGGVPSRPDVDLKLVDTDHKITMDLEWKAPKQTYGELTGYRVRYGRINQNELTDILKIGRAACRERV